MRSIVLSAVLTVSGLLLAALPPAAAEPVNATADFICGPHAVRLTIEDGRPSLSIDGAPRAIEQRRAASGVRYESVDGGTPLLFWEKGPEALLEIGDGGTIPCTATDNAEPGFLPFRARGNEPGWMLGVSRSGMTLITDYGDTTVEATDPVFRRIDGGLEVEAGPATNALKVRILDRLCRDDMSGTPYPSAVEVELGGKLLRGCGGEPRDLLTGREWTVAELDGAAIPAERAPTLKFGDGEKLGGVGGCNSYFTSAATKGRKLATGPVAATRRACPVALMAVEDRFFRILDRAVNFDVRDDGRELIIRADTGEDLVARR